MANDTFHGHSAHGPNATLWSRAMPRARQRPDPCEEPCTPRCPACGGLDCLCRPRFFPGQLLTDEDLNRFSRYVIEKNRLHNRHLHGWGVACGLEVVCDPCDPRRVLVREGYALSPCGDDIVVCADQSVDICGLIQTCEPREPVCEPPFQVPPRDCRGGNRKWVLAVCYDEWPKRGVTAMLGAGDTTASARCKCGGSGGCGCGGTGACGCGGSGGACSCGGAVSERSPLGAKRMHQPQCEPTQICEGFRFTAYPAPAPGPNDPTDPSGRIRGDLLWAWLNANRERFGPMISRILCCLIRAMELRQSIREGKTLDKAFALGAYHDYAAALAEFAADFAIHRCAFAAKAQKLREEAAAFNWDSPSFSSDTERAKALHGKVTALDVTWAEILTDCICSGLLPACPPPANTNCVPLAVVTVSDGECRVVEICNWSERRFLVTWPNVDYWLSWIQWDKLKDWIADFCCGPDRSQVAIRMLTAVFGTVAAGLKPASGSGSTTIQPFSAMASAAAAGPVTAPAPGPAVTPGTGAPAVTPELQAAFDAPNLMAHMAATFSDLRDKGAEATGQPVWSELVARASVLDLRAASLAPDPRYAALVKRLDDAEAMLDAQRVEIDQLKKGGGGGPV